MTTVIDMKTRRAWQIEPEPRRMSDAECVAQTIQDCSDVIFGAVLLIRAVAGLDTALRILGRAADEIKNQGRT